MIIYFSPRYKNKTQTGGSSITELEDELKKVYSGNWFIAEDYQQFVVAKNGAVSIFEP